MKTGIGLSDIEIHPQIDCREYRDLLNIMRGLVSDERLKPVALDLPKSKYGGNIGRDEWIANLIAAVFESNPNAKILVVVGNNHILKKLDWQNHVFDNHKSVRQYLSKKCNGLSIFSIRQIIGETVYQDDFR
jgi:hypothetical protein